MIELSKNYVALNMAKFIYEAESKQDGKQPKADIKTYFFDLYGECLKTVEANDPTPENG